ncbi:zinc finger protein 99-like isoform X2 [Uranotaenia lowii]|nr:zinc finger protein 99-like isoform X2 [Uranotaenia lowii]
MKFRKQCWENESYLRQKNNELNSGNEELFSDKFTNGKLVNCEILWEDGTDSQFSSEKEYGEIETVDDTASTKTFDHGSVKEEIYLYDGTTDQVLKDDSNSTIVEENDGNGKFEDVVQIQKRKLKRNINLKEAPSKRKTVDMVEASNISRLVCCGCPSKIFYAERELEAHRKEQHEKFRIVDTVIRPFECETCYQRFLTKKQLELHKARGLKTRKYVCNFCGNSFLAFSSQKRHEEGCSTTDKSYSCDECGKLFSQVASLRNHQKLHNSEKQHACPICGKKFLKKFQVPIHMVTHIDEQPFPCDQCPARFKRKHALHNHLKHHADPTPYECDLCSERFNNFSARKLHRQRVHEGREPFRCDLCGASYGRKTRLDHHIRRIHSEEIGMVGDEIVK